MSRTSIPRISYPADVANGKAWKIQLWPVSKQWSKLLLLCYLPNADINKIVGMLEQRDIHSRSRLNVKLCLEPQHLCGRAPIPLMHLRLAGPNLPNLVLMQSIKSRERVHLVLILLQMCLIITVSLLNTRCRTWADQSAKAVRQLFDERERRLKGCMRP